MCHYIENTHVLPGWGCCRCGVYNGLQRERCKSCQRERHPLNIPADLLRCEGCGFGFRPEHAKSIGPFCRVCARPLPRSQPWTA